MNIKHSFALWIVPKKAILKPITNEEMQWKKSLSNERSREYAHSRGYVRDALSYKWDMNPLDIPLFSPPSLPPELPKEFGYISFSHCIDSLFIAWSPFKVGTDIERFDRFFNAKDIIEKVFSVEEKDFLNKYDDENIRRISLSYWVRKEAAIKWQRGSLLKDMKSWVFNKKTNKIVNKKKGYKINSNFIKYKDWYIAISSEKNYENQNPIICQYE
tara:strand:+ start:951 stop:1595 length:645 start_codon:yes stop_codon:yes gene_type:complete